MEINFEELSKKICEKEGLKSLEILRTLSNVRQTILCEGKRGKVILSIGEQRPTVFRNGFESEKLVIPQVIKQDFIQKATETTPQSYFNEAQSDSILFPKEQREEGLGRDTIINSIKVDQEKIFYEIEEYLEGEIFSKIWMDGSAKGLPLLEDLEQEVVKIYTHSRELLDKLPITKESLSTFSEWFRRIFWRWKEEIKKKGLISSEDQIKILKKISEHPDYDKLIQGEFAYGHFSLTHFIKMLDGRIGLIDLTHAGLRPKYYDLTFFLWTEWFHISEEGLDEIDKTWDYMLSFFHKAIEGRQDKVKTEPYAIKQFYLVLLERALGALYDIAVTTDHVEKIFKDQDIRKQKLLKFLQAILGRCLEEI